MKHIKEKKIGGAFGAQRAETNPKDIAYIFIELAPGQYLELFPKADHQLEHEVPDTRLGYSHFALMVDDIHETREELVKADIEMILNQIRDNLKHGKCGFMILMVINLKLCNIQINHYNIMVILKKIKKKYGK